MPLTPGASMDGVEDARRTPPYHDTVLEFGTAKPFEIDLRRPVDAAALVSMRRADLDEPFAVITACNPGGARLDREENARRTEKLEALLRDRGIGFVGVDGCSPDRSRREPGFAVQLPLEHARALALEFRQDALFWFDGERFWLVAADGSMALLPPRS